MQTFAESVNYILQGETIFHRRAAEWFEATGDVDRAIQQATSGRDVERAARREAPWR